eukprot:231268-Prymnesium_polylepis.2
MRGQSLERTRASSAPARHWVRTPRTLHKCPIQWSASPPPDGQMRVSSGLGLAHCCSKRH